jgi:hypothetical protein
MAERPDTTDPGALFNWCLASGQPGRPQYLWGVLMAAHGARVLGIPRFTAIEFGVAGGNGLLALERAAAATTALTGVEVEIFGFDTGTGMPAPVDHRDVPWVIREGWFEMDEALLRSRLAGAQLVLGPVAQTVPAWLAASRPPVGFAAFDLDYYSATIEAFRVLDAPADRLLPRIVCYFDDLFGFGWSDFAGERAAIADFNAAHEHRKLGKIHGLRYGLPVSEQALAWPEQLYLAHAFDHPQYSTPGEPLAEAWFQAHRLAPER